MHGPQAKRNRIWEILLAVALVSGCRTSSNNAAVKDDSLTAPAPGSSAATSVQLPACGTLNGLCPDDIVPGGIVCTASDTEGNANATGQGNNSCGAVNDLENTLCSATPPADPTALSVTCVPGAGGANTSGQAACAATTTLRCRSGYHVSTLGCMQPHFIIQGGQTVTEGRCVKDALGGNITGFAIGGVQKTCAPLAAGTHCGINVESVSFGAACRARGGNAPLCADCTVLCTVGTPLLGMPVHPVTPVNGMPLSPNDGAPLEGMPATGN